MTVKSEYPHIVLDEEEVAFIEGTSMKVTELVVERLAYGWSPEELHLQHSYITLSQVHAALAYYWDHAEQLDEEIAVRLNNVEELRERSKREPSPVIARLRAHGRI